NMPKIIKAKLFAVIFILSVSFIFFSCEKGTEIVGGGPDENASDEENSVTLTGQVINGLTQTPIDSATILIVGGLSDIILTADDQGRFDTTISTNVNLNLAYYTYKMGYYIDTTLVYAMVNRVVNQIIRLYPISSTGGIPSGDPVSIFLKTQSAPFIGVRASGSEETARLIFVVQDSSGIPIDLDHSVDVSFTFGAAPGGGELLSPASVKTNDIGEAAVNLTSGTISGTVQIIATIRLPNLTITSLPVSITIHGGLPDAAHFSIAPQYLNFAGYNIYGLTDVISAYVGDKYGNPVRPETSVYFTSTGGIIEGSTKTNELGIGSVQLVSADPKPFDTEWEINGLGAGFAEIKAHTSDENQTIIYDSIIVLFSGVPGITINPTSFDIPNGGQQLFNYTVMDQNQNPLAGGTRISVEVAGDDAGLLGDVSFSLPDTQSPAWTQFSFILYDTKPDTTKYVPVGLGVVSEGPNGRASVTITGHKR
ncbi:MAG: hypothetical protein ACM34N_01185, partial [Ignavibacteria bacterium]